MTNMSDDLMKRLRFLSAASTAFAAQGRTQLNSRQRALTLILHEDQIVQSYLAEVLDLRPSSLAELLKKMETNGDIVRTEDENDRRIKHISLTEQGREKATSFDSLKNENRSEEFFAGLTEEERLDFDKLINKIVEGWSTEFKDQSAQFVDPMERLKVMQEMRADWFEKNGHGHHEMPRGGMNEAFGRRFREFHQRMHDEHERHERREHHEGYGRHERREGHGRHEENGYHERFRD